MYEDIPEALKKYYPGGIFGFDLDGRPVYYEPIGKVDFVGILHSASRDDVVRYRKQQCEHLQELCKQQETLLGKKLDTVSTLVLDAKGGGMKHLWKPGIESYQSILKLYETEFPNLREHILVINTSPVYPIINSLLKPFMSSDVSSKTKVLGSDWKNELQKYISKENIPEYYGGTAKDSNGDPKCQEFICYGGEVPKSYYNNEIKCEGKIESVIIKPGKTFTKEIEIDKDGKNICYQFKTTNFNLKFSVNYRSLDTDDVNVIIHEKKVDSELIVQEGHVTCDKIGTYVFIFDNSYSWMRSKELFYNFEVC